MFRDLTWQVEECVKDIKALRIVSLDELVWVPFADFRPGKKTKHKPNRSFFVLRSCVHTYVLLTRYRIIYKLTLGGS